MERRKILIIDDEPSFGDMVKLNLEDTGKFEVRIETEGSKAVSAALEFKPDLILLDVIMPGLDGGEVVVLLKSEESLKDIPVIFLTAIVRDKEVAAKDGIISGYPFLAKPVSTDDLIACIEENLKK